MKIRIKGNSIRLRLTKSEVSQLATIGSVIESTAFPNANGSLTYELRSNIQVAELSASFVSNTITILMREELAKSWETSDQIGHDYRIPLDGENYLYLLIEKDFVCLDNSREDQADNYPHPTNEKC